MTHHAFGYLVGDDELGGLLQTNGCVFIDSYLLVNAETSRGTPIIGCQISGTVHGTEDTINTVYLLNPKEAGALVRAFMSSAENLDPEDYMAFLLAAHGDAENAEEGGVGNEG